MNTPLEDEIEDLFDFAIDTKDEASFKTKFKQLLKEHIHVHSIRGGNYPVYTLTIEFGEFLND